MALHWDITKVQNYKEKCWTGGNLSNLTKDLIEITMVIGMGKITENNCKEFHTRLELANTLLGWRRKITEEDVKNHIGLATNVSNITWNNFVKLIMKQWCRDQNFNPSPPKKAKAN